MAIAKRYLGVRYVYGGASPKTGFDCSGFVMYVYAKLGISMPHSSSDQWHMGVRIARKQLEPGDLVFFDGKKEPGHVGMYVGGAKFIHAPHTGDVVKISRLSGSYARNYVGAIRPYGLGPPIVFPVVGPSRYGNTFNATPSGLLPGNDIVAKRKALVVAAESGRIKTWTRSKAGGCMLYLYGHTGRTYEYLHLNNDLTKKNDNKGRCVAGTAYAPGLVTGQKVKAGQLIGFVGDSGRANGTQPHLHFEVHRGQPVNPYPYLNRARRPLFAVLPGPDFTLSLHGKVVSRTDSTLTFSVSSLQAWPGGYRLSKVRRSVTVSVSANADVQLDTPGLASRSSTTIVSARKGQKVSVRTTPAPLTLKALLGKSGALDAHEIILGTVP